MADYKIELGVKLNTSDLKTEINKLDDKHKVKLGVDLKVNDIRERITQYNKNSNNAKLKLGIKLDTDSLKQEINKLNLSGSNKGKGIAIPIDTQSLEISLEKVERAVIDIKNSLGSLDDKMNARDLVSSVNQIATALEKATNESDGLVASLNALSKKDFSVNVGVNMGSNNPIARNAAYGSKVRTDTLPQLKQQITALENYLKQYYKVADGFIAAQKLVQGTTVTTGQNNLLTLLPRMLDTSASLSSQMSAYKEYISLIKEAAKVKGIDLSHITSGFSKSADELIKDAQNIQTGTNEAKDSFEKLKQVFSGSNIDADALSRQLDSIVTNLSEIKTTIQGLSSGVSLEGLTSSFEKLSNSIELLVKNCTTAKQAINDSIGSGLSGSAGNTNSGVKNLNNDLKQITITADNTSDAIQSMRNAMSSMKFNTSSIDAATKDLEEMNIVIKEVSAKDGKNFDITVKGINDVGEAVTLIKRFNAETSNFDTISTKISKPFDKGVEAAKRFRKEAETIKNIKFDIEIGNFDNDLSKMYDRFNKLSGASQELEGQIKAVDNAFEKMMSAYKLGDDERLIEAQKEYAKAIEKANNLLSEQARIEAAENRAKKLKDSKASLKLDMVNWLQKNTKAAKEYGEQINELIASLDRLDDAGVKGARRQFNYLTKDADSKGLTGLTVIDKIKSKFKEYASYFSTAEVFMYAEQALRSMFDTVVEIDTAMTGLYRVTDLTSAQYEILYNNMISSAKEYGATLNDIINATTDWVRAGFDADTALGLAEVTTMYQHISDLDYDTAAENLITAYNGFKDELNSLYSGDEVAAVQYIADIFNELDNNFAVTSAGLGEALTRSASALDLAGNSIQETAGMVTGIVEVTQDPEKAGSALKVLSLRLRGMKGQLEELGEETDENVENLSKMQGQILNMTKGKVNIFEADGSFKSTYEIMKGIAEVWDSLSSIDQADLLETIAGKNRANDVAALLSNWENVEAAVKSASEAEGSAAEENAKYVDSLQGRLDKLTTAWQSFANTFMESDFLKGVISGLTTIVELIESLTKNVGTLGTIGLGAGIFSMFKNRSSWANVGGIISSFTSVIPQIMSSTDKLGTKFKTLGSFAKTAGKDIGKSLTSSLSGTVGAIGLVVAAVGLAVNAYKNYKEEQSRLRQETIETSNTFLDAAGSFEQVYIKYSGRTDLTTEEEAELESAIKGTVDALGNKSSALQNVVNSSNDYLSSLEEISRAERQEANRAAKAKREAAKKELEETASGWASWDGSEVNLSIKRGSEAARIAKEMKSEFFLDKTYSTNNGEYVTTVMEFRLSGEADADEVVEYYYTLLDYQERLNDANLADTSEYETVTKHIETLSEAVGTYTDGVYDAAKAQYELAYGYPTTVEAYLKMRESVLGDIEGSTATKKTFANTLDSEYGQYFDLTTAEAQYRKLIGIIDGFGDNEAREFEVLLNTKTALNNNECTVGDYISQFNKIGDTISSFSEEDQKEIELAFGLDTDKVKKQYDEVLAKVASSKNMTFVEAKEFVDSLSLSELSAAFSLKGEINWENGSPEEILAKIEEEVRLNESIAFSVDLEIETEKLENLSAAISESVSGAGLSTESISLVEDMFGNLDGYDKSTLFERTANGIRLNSDELRKLNDEYKKTNVDGLNGKIDALGERYLQTREELSNLTYGTDEYNEKARELSDIEAQINAAETLASQYQGLASAYQEWQRAESAGSQRDMYESIIEGFENVDDEISRGWLDDGTIEFLRLIKGDTLSATATTKELKKAYESLDDTIKNTSYSVRDFFTVDEDGNSTNTGVYNFLDAIGQLEEEAFGGKDVVKRDKNGNIIAFDFQIAGGDKAIAEALGISEELVQIMVRAADDAGFVVSMDGTYQQLDVLKEKAQEAANKLKDTFKKTKFEFDLDTSSEDSVLKQYQEALKIWEEFKKNKNEDGTVNMNVKGAEEAYTLVSTLQSMVDKLSEPVYMELNASQVEKDMQAPLAKLQEYETLTQTEHQLQLKGTDTTEIENSKKEILDYFENLDPEIKADLGIKNLSREEIQKKVEAGEIKIPATIDLQVEMNNTLRDMVNIALYNAGLLGEGEEGKAELEKRVDISLYADKVDTSDVEEKTEEEVEKATKDNKRKTNIEIIAEVFGVNDVDSLSEKLKGLDDETVQAIAKVIGQTNVDSLKETLATLGAEDKIALDIIAKAMGEGDVTRLKEGIDKLSPKTVEAIAKALGYSGVEELKSAVASMDGNTVQAVAQALGLSDVNTLQITINNMHGNTVDAKVNTDGQKEKINTLQSWINGLKGKIVNIGVQLSSAGKKKAAQRTGADPAGNDSEVNGTANVNGTTGRAFKQGSWGTKNSGTALVGELGRETLVRDGRYYTIGDSGAEFIKYQKGDIIFNHKQTEELFKNGRVTSGGGRAKALVDGSAFLEGTAFSRGVGGIGKVSANVKGGSGYKTTTVKTTETKTTETTTTSTGSGGIGKVDKGKLKESSASSSSSSSSSAKDDFKETFDWIEVAISRLERTIDQLDKKASNVYSSWSDRNSALSSQISKVGDEINLQQQAYDRYMQEANSVGLSSSWAEKVRNGKIDINTITDEKLAEKIGEYQDWYEKALDCKDAILDLKETESSLYAQRFENIQTQYDSILQGYEHTETMLNEYISQAEEQGHIISKKYYHALIDNEKDSIDELKKEQADLIAERDNAVDSGKIVKYSEEWYNMCSDIDSVTQAIEESETALLEYDNAMRDIDWQIFDLTQERISAVTEEADFLIELMSNKKLFDEDGKLTSQGLATMGLHAQNYNTHMYKADEYGAEVAKLDKQIANDPYDQELINRRKKQLELQRESILAAEDEKNAIRDMVEEGIEYELDALQERIDKYEEAMDSAKDLYDYQKRVQEQSKEIASLEKQMAAYSGDDSEEAQQKIQQIKVDLEAARQDLEETEYDKFISDSSALLDTLYNEYELILNQRLDNVDALLEEVIASINTVAGVDGVITSALGNEGAIALALGNNAVSIKDTLTSEAKNVGTTLSSAMNSIWSVGEGNAKSVLTMYGEDFKAKSTTINTTLNGIKIGVNSVVSALNKEAQKKVASNKTSTSAKKDPTKNSNGNKGKNNEAKKKSSSTGDGKPKIGDKVRFVTGSYYYDSQGKQPLGSKYHGKDVYITSINDKKWATHPYHISVGTKLGKGDLGWLKLNQLSGYAVGNKNFLDNEVAWTQENGREFIVRPSDGAILIPVAKGDSILNATASNNIWDMANSPAEFIKDNLNLGSTNVPNNSNTQNSYTQILDKVVFNMPNVKNYNEFLTALKSDKNFEKLILSMTLDQVAGKSGLAKGKSIR